MSTHSLPSRRTVAVLEPGYASYDTEREVLAAHDCEIVTVAPDEAAVAALGALDPVAVLVRERHVGQAEMAACPNLRVVVRYGVGVDNIDLDHARARGIHVANVPDYGAEHEVSDHALALYLAVQRRIVSRDREVRAGLWGIGQDAVIPSRENATLGLIGCGRIGMAAVAKFRAFGFDRVLVVDPSLGADVCAAHRLTKCDLDRLCREADVISLHAPLTPETHHVLDAAAFARMKPTTILVNVSRGGLVDETALAAALHEGRLFGAGIDVFEAEPVARDNPLLDAPNTVLSDHGAWYSERSVAVLQRKAAEAILAVLNDEIPSTCVNAP